MSRRFPDSDECVKRLRGGDPTALVLLLEALEREKDPRAYPLARRLEEAMEESFSPPPGGDLSTNVVSNFQLLCVFALRLMQPKAGAIARSMLGRRIDRE